MKKYLFTLSLVLGSTFLFAQQKNKIALGFNLNQFQSDFGLGVHVISPYFGNNAVAVKVGANLQWFQHSDGDETVWSPYNNFQIGFRGRHPVVKDKIFVYGEGGMVLLLPNSKLSSEKSVFGGYGLFGFEFFANKSLSYYIELGGMGTAAKADKVATKPIYSNGFTSSVGLRMQL